MFRIPTPLARLLVSCSALTFGLAASADAAALYFVRLEVKTASEATCYRFASDVTRSLGFSNVRRGPLEVAGQKGGVYLSTTCVGRGQARVMAVVMATGDAFPATRQVATEFANRLGGMICFDTPC